MKKLLKAIRCASVKKQFLAFIIGLFLALVIFCVMMIGFMVRAQHRESLQYVEENRENYEEAVTVLYNQVSAAFIQLQYNSSCKAMLSAATYGDISLDLIDDVNTALSSVKTGNTVITDVAFVNDLLHWSLLYSSEQLDALNAAMTDQRGMMPLGICKSYYSAYMKRKQDTYLVFGYPYYSGRVKIGTLLISVDIHSTAAQIPVPQGLGSFMMLMNADGTACIFSEEDMPADSTITNVKTMAAEDSMPKTLRTIDKNGYVIQISTLPQAGCMLVSAIDTRESQLSFDSFYTVSGIFLILFTVLLFLGGQMLYHSVVSPLNKFSSTIAYVRENRLRKLKKPLELNGCSEIRALGKDFSDLLLSLNALSEEIFKQSSVLYEAEVLRKNAELDSLRSQINPHFLYNTLEMIRDAAIKGDAEQVSRVTSAIGKIYRYTVKGAPLVPLSQEIDIIKAYVSIQQARFQNRITTIYNVSEAAACVPVFKMLLQPLVENAFVHGLEPKPDNGVLYIGARTDENMLCITIRDNGVGIEPERLEEIRHQIDAGAIDTSSHLGLVNVDARIKLQYGKEYGLEISGLPMDGTCMTIRLPIDQSNTKKGDEKDVSGSAGGR